VHGAKRPQQGSFVDFGEATQISHMLECARVETGDFLKTVDQLSITLGLTARHGARLNFLSSRQYVYSPLPMTQATEI
jgi:hypothetical protein